MKHLLLFLAAAVAAGTVVGCSSRKTSGSEAAVADSTMTKVTHPEWSKNAVIYEVNLRQYTDSGNITSFARELPRLKDLGVDILWFMPVNPISQKDRKGTLGSYYAVADYTAFNPEFGTIDQFKDAVKKAHELGMKVILDWVPNHTGRDNRWVTEHSDWYKKDSLGNMIGLYDWTDVYCLDYSNPETRKGMIEAMKFWLTEVDVDGFRCDVAMEVPTDFWNEARPQLQAVKPELFMLAEASKPELHKEAFDMGYNWPMSVLNKEIAATSGQYTFKNKEGKIATFPERHASDIDSLLEVQAKEYPAGTYLMNMITNHDFNSWEGTEFDRLGNLQAAFAVLSYTLPGMPMMYTGQETGMNRAFEFFEKDKAPEWEPRNEFFTFYQTLNGMKHTQSALNAGLDGAPMKRFATESKDLYVFERRNDESAVLVMVNLGKDEQPLKFTGEAPKVEGLTDLFANRPAAMPASLAPGAYYVAVKK